MASVPSKRLLPPPFSLLPEEETAPARPGAPTSSTSAFHSSLCAARKYRARLTVDTSARQSPGSSCSISMTHSSLNTANAPSPAVRVSRRARF